METAPAAPTARRDSTSLRRFTPRKRRSNPADRAFESFYNRHVGEVYQYALAVLTNPADAEDVTQQTFLNAYRAFQKGQRPEIAHNWLIKIAHNVCRMRWRQSARRPQEVPLENVAEPIVLDDVDKPTVDDVLRALATLPFTQRAALVMREVEGRSYNEIAEVLGTSVSSVEALLFRARRRLQAKRALGVLSTAPLPGSLASFFGGGGGLLAAGSAVIGGDVALKAAAVVASGIVAGGMGFQAVKAVANSSKEPKISYRQYPPAPLFVSDPAKLVVSARRVEIARAAGFAHPARGAIQGARKRSGGSRGTRPSTPTPTVAAPTGGGQTDGGSASSSTQRPSSPVESTVRTLPVKPPVAPPQLPSIPVQTPPVPTVPDVPTVSVPTVPVLPPPPLPK